MAEQFGVVPAHVAGYAVLTDDISRNVYDLTNFVGVTVARGEFAGLMSLLRGPAEDYRGVLSQRLNDRAARLSYTSDELNRSAWLYSDADESAYTQFNYSTGLVGYKDYTDPYGYPDWWNYQRPADPELAEADFRAQIDEVGGALAEIDGMIAEVTGWSPITEIIEPLAGNPNELRAAAEALRAVATEAESAANALTGSLGLLDTYWNGGAAQEFMSYANRMAAAIEEEGPLNRVVAHVYDQAAAQVEAAAGWMVTTLKEAVDRAVAGLASGWIPFYGWYRVYDTVKFIIEVVQEALKIIAEVEQVLQDAQRVLEIASDPVAAAQGAIEERLAPIQERIEQGQTAIEFGQDVVDLADYSEWTEAPTSDYDAGADPRRSGA